MGKKQGRDCYFWCQYQAGKVTVSDVVTATDYISVGQMMGSLCRLAVGVKKEIDPKVGGRVALKVLHIINELIKSVNNDRVGSGGSRSFYMDKKSKHKLNWTERVDVEFYGLGGMDRAENKEITKFIKYWQAIILKQG